MDSPDLRLQVELTEMDKQSCHKQRPLRNARWQNLTLWYASNCSNV